MFCSGQPVYKPIISEIIEVIALVYKLRQREKIMLFREEIKFNAFSGLLLDSVYYIDNNTTA
ncbi:hypothetical protein VP1G_11060 [Cytospora mali]|uniref:Uncharacterized protein n=1 Tax=Cytospora mali TaxID=578113 RepID=A0A194V3N6_CYTMA|nr:hypothetical protein VP1G_11060 [Valsa mali var. pyri (nom. inval.)]